MSSRRARRVLAAICAAAGPLTLLGSVPAAGAAVPAYTLEERAEAIAQPAVIFTEILSEGIIRDRRTRKAVTPKTMTIGIRCSAVVISSSGIALSTNDCVAPSRKRLAELAFEQLANQLIDQNKLTEANKKAYIDQLTLTSDFTAASGPGDPPRRVFAQLGTATARLTSSPAITVEAPPAAEDDENRLTAINLGVKGLPAVELDDTATIAGDAEVVAIGYHPIVAGKTYEVTTTATHVTGTRKGTPVSYKFSDDLPSENRGGALVDLEGHLTGALLWSDAGNDVETIKQVLSQVGVTNSLSDTDKLYREAIDDYFAGRYSAAMKKLDTVKAAAPSNAMAERYRALATSRAAIEGGEPATSFNVPMWAIAAASGLVGAVLAVVIAVVLLRRRRTDQNLGETLVPISVNPFAPTSGPGAHPTSGAGFTHYPHGGYAQVSPASGDAFPHPNVLEIPQAAPPGMPVPRPPVQQPPAQHQPPMQQPPMQPPVPQQPPMQPPVPQQPPMQPPVPQQPPMQPPVQQRPVEPAVPPAPMSAPPAGPPGQVPPRPEAPSSGPPLSPGLPAIPMPAHHAVEVPAPEKAAPAPFAWPDDESIPADEADNPWGPPPQNRD
ncbi:hypothetical protein AB0H43_36190 [Hamadaea sp. NPDC050747]|uniref:hypothetical protein n=1 Tax=Hamadaea sp. NPDC050747 TaxID=3155789 RepID=UPI0034112A1F